MTRLADATLPNATGVIVSSTATKTGSVLSGTTAHIVGVEVDPGHGPAPGHTGASTILKTVC